MDFLNEEKEKKTEKTYFFKRVRTTVLMHKAILFRLLIVAFETGKNQINMKNNNSVHKLPVLEFGCEEDEWWR